MICRHDLVYQTLYVKDEDQYRFIRPLPIFIWVLLLLSLLRLLAVLVLRLLQL